MSLFKRIGDNIRANINSLLDKAEDPVKMLEQYLRDMAEDIAEAETAVAKQIAVVKRFEAQYQEAQAMVEKRESQAMAAVESGREDLARRALEDKRLNQTKADEFYAQYQQYRDVADRLKLQLTDMKEEYEKMKARKAALVARAQAAKAQKSVNDVMSGFGKNNARGGFERMEEKVLQAEAEAQAGIELRSSGDNLDDELAALGQGTSDIDIEMQRLREKVKNRQ
ncbi:phage shock protein A, PspA [Desulfofarcimen acetoxidans DSM 771]|uniref:Phage shock protein A, PspA n=1 Tax=Desulfofarcimen acetoxidans (strain ATCC 49208 / DSM 771 / KCTC 5769 / VKM B-1644 / 5575) TaxID=485916 RepID=C8VVV0_DESAS|nr:PspA/IM30 family protein [Desulfofarcimen acetoxidans]ACV64237.1 phage shock protein A, PspA [Desulfofarcimen acetoxidans DSM 771]